MTEKRFVGSSGGVYDRYKGDRFTWSEWEEIIRIMNNLNEKARERSKALSKLQKENEQLKKTITTTDELLMNQWKENQRIKHTIKEAHYNERTAIGKSVLKQLIDKME